MKSADVEMNLRPWNRNFVGTHYGGSLYSMSDPFYMLMLIDNLGDDYIVWGKAAHIRFRLGVLHAGTLDSVVARVVRAAIENMAGYVVGQEHQSIVGVQDLSGRKPEQVTIEETSVSSLRSSRKPRLGSFQGQR